MVSYELSRFAESIALMSYTKFDWSTAPLSDIRCPLFTGAAYTLVVLCWYFSGGAGPSPEQMAKRDVQLKPLVAVHNLILCLGSLAMFVGCAYEMQRRTLAESSFDWFFCEAPTTKAIGPLFFWSYLYYLSKYYELIDTLLQLMRGRAPPHFALHVYHHACVMMMSWAWCEYVQTLQFGGLLFNTAVHVVMYLYFFLRVTVGPPWWKKYVTMFQIIQVSESKRSKSKQLRPARSRVAERAAGVS